MSVVFGETHAHAALASAEELLAGGDLKRGFSAYESRWHTGKQRHLAFKMPPWQGESLAGKSIYVRHEQGFGDTLQFVRYLPMLEALGARVLFTPPSPLARLLAGFGARPALDETPPDFHIPLLSLPHRFGTTLDTIPIGVPYVRPPGDLSVKLKRPAGTRLAVGIVWAGDPRHANDRQRSMPASLLLGLADLPGVALYSLQIGQRALAVGSPAADLSAELTDFAHTAALLTELDLVVSVDTAIVHLAGAMARRCFVLLPHVADWRWLRDRDDSPWYPTLRLFRQETPGDWIGVMQRVRAEIVRLLD